MKRRSSVDDKARRELRLGTWAPVRYRSRDFSIRDIGTLRCGAHVAALSSTDEGKTVVESLYHGGPQYKKKRIRIPLRGIV